MLPKWSVAPAGTSAERQRNFLNVQMDAVGVGIVAAAVPFLPVFLTRLGASNFEIGLLTAMPALGGLVLATPSGRLLQRQSTIVPWLSVSRLLVAVCFTLTGLVPFVVNGKAAVAVVLLVWAAATLPQSMGNVAFYLVMNAVAGPEGRYDLMSRRWFILGLATALGVAAAGAMLDRLGYPLNYQLAFLCLSVGGLIGYCFSTRIVLRSFYPPDHVSRRSLAQEVRDHFSIIWSERGFISLNLKQFVFLSGTAISAPLFPLYYVRVVDASDTWIGIINTAQVAVVSVAYLIWARQQSVRGTRSVLLTTTLATALVTMATALTRNVQLIALIAAVSGLFQAGIDLVFFDELMRSIPEAYAPTFVAFAQSMQYLTLSVGPLFGTALADRVGIGQALVASALFRLVGFALFVSGGSVRTRPEAPSTV
jgi:MFS family permease